MNVAKPKFVGTISANPGFYVLTEIGDDNGYPVEADKAPVVAWALEEDSLAAYPVTLEGVQTDNDYVLYPDGAVERPGIDGFRSVTEWLAAQQDDHAKTYGPQK